MTVPDLDRRIPDLVGLTGAARILGVHRNTVLNRIKSGHLMASRIDGSDGEWVLLRTYVESVAHQESQEETTRPVPHE